MRPLRTTDVGRDEALENPHGWGFCDCYGGLNAREMSSSPISIHILSKQSD